MGIFLVNVFVFVCSLYGCFVCWLSFKNEILLHATCNKIKLNWFCCMLQVSKFTVRNISKENYFLYRKKFSRSWRKSTSLEEIFANEKPKSRKLILWKALFKLFPHEHNFSTKNVFASSAEINSREKGFFKYVSSICRTWFNCLFFSNNQLNGKI